jgi:HK97 family phage major capsid protein
MTTDQLRRRLAELRASLTRLSTLPGDLNANERAAWEGDLAEYEALAAQLEERGERARAMSDALERGDDSVTLADGDGVRGLDSRYSRPSFNVATRMSNEDLFDRSRLDPLRDSDGPAYRDRALAIVDRWGTTFGLDARHQTSAAALVENADESARDRQIADYFLRYSSPEYVSAFRKVCRDPATGHLRLDAQERAALADGSEAARAMSEGSGAVGQFMVPPFLDPAIILTNTGISNPFRQISTVKTITTQSWKGVTSDGVTAAWSAEAAEMTDNSPTLVQPTITPIRATAYVQASFEMIEDTDIASELAMLFADARDRLEGAAFAVGTGSTQPSGIQTEMSLQTASRVAANTNGQLNAYDIFNLDNSLSQRFRANASWVANKSMWNAVRQLAMGAGAMTGSFWVDFGGARPSTLIGYPVYESSALLASLSTATASSDYAVYVGDWRNYYIVDRIGLSIAYNPMVIGGTRRMPTGEVGWACFWRTGGAAVNRDAFRVLIV